MGLFDFLKGGRKDVARDGGGDKKIASLTRTASNIRAQAYDRDEALRSLTEIGTPEAAAGLLKRFSVKVDPSITDEAEKQLAYDGILSIGQGEHRQAVIDRILAYCRSAENLTWPIKVLRALLDDEGYQEQLLTLLGEHDTEYVRNVEPKVNLLAALEDVKSEETRKAVEPYLGDVNETVRFHALQTLFAQGDPASVPAMVEMVRDEESVRVKNKVADGLARLEWTVPAELRSDFASALRDVYEYRVRDDGRVEKT